MGALKLLVRTDRQQAADAASTDTSFLLQAQDVEDSSDELSDQSDSFESVDSAGSEEADRWVVGAVQGGYIPLDQDGSRDKVCLAVYTLPLDASWCTEVKNGICSMTQQLML